MFESGALNADGSIHGNDNDADATKFEPHYTEIRSADQVQIYESILGDPNGAVTTGLLTATRYLKDNRLLPRGFDKRTAEPDIAVHGERGSTMPTFVAGGDRVRYSVPRRRRGGSVHGRRRAAVSADRLPLGEQPEAVRRAEPRRFTTYYDAMLVGDGDDARARQRHGALNARAGLYPRTDCPLSRTVRVRKSRLRARVRCARRSEA